MASGLRKVTDDMKAKNRPDRSGVVSASTGDCQLSLFCSLPYNANADRRPHGVARMFLACDSRTPMVPDRQVQRAGARPLLTQSQRRPPTSRRG